METPALVVSAPPWPGTRSIRNQRARLRRGRAGQGRAGLSVSDVSDHSRKTTNQPKKKTEGKEKNVEISSVVLKAAKHCLIFNGGICLFEKLYSKVNDEERNPDIFVILNFLFFFYYCVALSVMLLSG